jgi:hypothetical protein
VDGAGRQAEEHGGQRGQDRADFHQISFKYKNAGNWVPAR